jgi:hypothetical protein
MKILSTAFLAFLASAILFSCGSGDSENQKEQDLQDVSITEENSELKEEYRKAVKGLPSPLEISQFIESTGAAYDRNIMNPYESVDKYATTNQKKALNLGIYTADLGYACAYYVQEDIIQYVNAVKLVSDQLGVAGSFTQDKIAKFEQSLPNEDSLIKVITESMYNTDEVLVKNDKLDMAALILAGSFIEGLHISTSIVKNYPPELPDEIRFQILNPLIEKIYSQRETLNNLISILEKFENEGAITEMRTKLVELRSVYETIDEEKAAAEENADQAEMALSVLNKVQLTSLTEKVTEIRNQIVS